jgi:hypothetical protein
LDIYVANDTDANFLYLNRGGGSFIEKGELAGVALGALGGPDGSMGVEACDYNNDGQLDIWVTNYEHESFALYRNDGRDMFLHVSGNCGITALGGLYVGWGTRFADWDRDGDLDAFVTNGHVLRNPVSSALAQRATLLENQDNGGMFRLVAASSEEYLGQDHRGRGLASGDLDEDGDLDAVISHVNEPVAVLENRPPEADWISARLIGTVSNRDAIGAELVLHTSAGDWVRQITGGGSYLSQSDRRAYWGLPRDVQVLGLSVRWPSGARSEVPDPPRNRVTTLIEQAETNP